MSASAASWQHAAASAASEGPEQRRAALRRRVRVRVHGTVQGVGFRPYVYRLARGLALAGFVLNDPSGVLLEVEGAASGVDAFLAQLAPCSPPLAVIESVRTEELEPCGEREFAIRSSPREGAIEAPVAPDAATCEQCLRELFDPRDRRFRYPFINCTNCGPRLTIVCAVPYDRPFTTMARFRMCARCASEYADPDDRRFHAQPNACSECGPSLTLLRADGRPASLGSARDPVQAAARALKLGRIVAVKGIGGYHLACRADEETAVARLRARKRRAERPFAVMAGSLAQAERLVALSPVERRLVCSPERPIVLAPRRADAAVAPSLAPAVLELGVMLPYSPLHHLLLHDAGVPLVMTSGNLSEEPIAYQDEDALTRLGAVAELLLVHDRPIETRTDDSVVRVLARPRGPHQLMLRRSRGYVPASLALAPPTEQPLLACGGQLKNTFCVAKDGRAWVSHHIGDLANYETLRAFSEGIARFEALFEVAPALVAHDLHPGYLSTRYALEREGVELVGVQHHHAHLAACLAEHGQGASAVGAIFDGTGFGPDGTVWGGELLLGDLVGFHRVGMLRAVRLPGGASAIGQPWRMGCAWLCAAREADGDRGGEQDDAAEVPTLPSALRAAVSESAWRHVARMARGGPNSPLTTSMGRLFDAVAALCGLRAHVNYEGQAAVELEAACDPHCRGSYPIALVASATGDGGASGAAYAGEVAGGDASAGGAQLVIDPRETIRAVSRDVEAGVALGVIASSFHAAVASATVQACVRAASEHGVEQVVLSGGVFQNRRLLEAAWAGLERAGLRVLVPARLPLNDGGISYGQAAVAAARAAGRSSLESRSHG